jgi:hypothetical protein
LTFLIWDIAAIRIMWMTYADGEFWHSWVNALFGLCIVRIAWDKSIQAKIQQLMFWILLSLAKFWWKIFIIFRLQNCRHGWSIHSSVLRLHKKWRTKRMWRSFNTHRLRTDNCILFDVSTISKNVLFHHTVIFYIAFYLMDRMFILLWRTFQ